MSGSNHLVRLQTCKKAMGWCTAQWKMLLSCVKTIVKESRKFELARLKRSSPSIGSQVLPIVDYACVVWDPHLKQDQYLLESVQTFGTEDGLSIMERQCGGAQ